MKAPFLAVLLFTSTLFWPASGIAQTIGQGNSDVFNSPEAQAQKIWVITGAVKTVNGDPVRGATVTVAPLSAAPIRVLYTKAQGEFLTQYNLYSARLNALDVAITVKKKGFRAAHAFARYVPGKTFEIPVTLREPEEDPAQLPAAELVSALASRLKQLGPADGLSAKSMKDYARAVEAFLDQRRPERAVPILRFQN